MRILHVISDLDPASGGPPQVVIALAAAQAGLGHDVGVLSHERDAARSRIDAMLAGVPRGSSIARHSAPAPGRLTAGLGFAGLGPALALPEADICHLHGVWDPLLLRAARACRRAGRPWVVVPHGMLDPWSLGQSRLKKRVALALGARRMLDGAAFLHVLNDDEARLLGPLRLSAPLEVIPNGIFAEAFDDLPAPGTFRRAHPEVADDPFILFLGRLHFKKGLDHLADAFARLAPVVPAAHLVVAGPDDGAQADFESRIGRAGLADRVHVVGPLYGPEKLGALVDAAVFCLPSRQEGFSMAITEAMACGLPVVASEACHYPWIAEHEAGVVVPLEPGAVADALGSVLADEPARRRMGERGRALVLERFTWPRIAEITIDAYRRHGAGGAPAV